MAGSHPLPVDTTEMMCSPSHPGEEAARPSVAEERPILVATMTASIMYRTTFMKRVGWKLSFMIFSLSGCADLRYPKDSMNDKSRVMAEAAYSILPMA